jgi:hypothetical protein
MCLRRRDMTSVFQCVLGRESANVILVAWCYVHSSPMWFFSPLPVGCFARVLRISGALSLRTSLILVTIRLIRQQMVR